MTLPREFYDRPTLDVARDLIGKVLVCQGRTSQTAGAIVEVEAYIGESDAACHASAGRTPRNEPLYGPPGLAYVYLSYGVHNLFNVVTEAEGSPAAVLVRALEPLEGISVMERNRKGRTGFDLCSGPAKLAQALDITRALNGADLCARRGAELWIEDAPPIPNDEIAAGPRIGLNSVPEPWFSKPWRFYIASSQFVSRR